MCNDSGELKTAVPCSYSSAQGKPPIAPKSKVQD